MTEALRSIPEGWKMTTLGILPINWEVIAIKHSDIQIGDGNYSSKYPRQDELLSFGIPFISSTDLKFGKILNDSLRYISPEMHDLLQKGHLKTGDILIVVRGNGVGDIAITSSKYNDANINAQLAYLRSNEHFDQRFLYFLLGSSTFKKYIMGFVSGSAQPQLTIGQLMDIEIIKPPLPEQKAIAEVLSSLDNKIELLREQNQTLERIAQTIFKEWFVNFNFPTADGKPFRSSGGTLIESDLGPIPVGWRVGKLEEIIEIKNGSARPKDGKLYPVFGGNGILAYADEFNIDEKIIVVGRVGAYCGNIYFEEDKLWLSDNALGVVSKEKNSIEFLLYLLKLLELNRSAIGGAQPLLTQGLIKQIDITVPPRDLISSFNNCISQIQKKVFCNNSQIQTLSTLRDELLPKLMKGELRVNTLGEKS